MEIKRGFLLVLLCLPRKMTSKGFFHIVIDAQAQLQH